MLCPELMVYHKAHLNEAAEVDTDVSLMAEEVFAMCVMFWKMLSRELVLLCASQKRFAEKSDVVTALECVSFGGRV